MENIENQMPPLHKKRIVAFLNNFLISSCEFLNEFATRCESKFIDLERKMQKIEAALIILEAKLNSVPVLEEKPVQSQTTIPTTEVAIKTNEEEIPNENSKECAEEDISTVEEVGVRACDDVRYRKFFKMLQFGVPIAAVKLKMQTEGMENPDILDSPNLILTDGISYKEDAM